MLSARVNSRLSARVNSRLSARLSSKLSSRLLQAPGFPNYGCKFANPNCIYQFFMVYCILI